jgi:hypothetical protein
MEDINLLQQEAKSDLGTSKRRPVIIGSGCQVKLKKEKQL